jgi:nitroimidazol reductase NimA-like FMN-containing flavoprotein (pyridoxamine 5'-phosphate oxidase superfamily)
MRRRDREMTDAAALAAVLQRAQVCHLAMCDGDQPYVVPMNFGHQQGVLYFHSAREGRKLDVLRRNPRVCFACHTDFELVLADHGAGCTTRYQSVIGFGTARIVDDLEAKKAAYAVIMRHYTDRPFTLPPAALDKSLIIQVTVDHITGKRS